MSFRVTPTHFPRWKEKTVSLQILLKTIKVTQKALWLCLHFEMGLCARSEQSTKLIILHMAVDIMPGTPKANNSTTNIIIFGPPPGLLVQILLLKRDIFPQCFDVGHSWMISLGCPDRRAAKPASSQFSRLTEVGWGSKTSI